MRPNRNYPGAAVQGHNPVWRDVIATGEHGVTAIGPHHRSHRRTCDRQQNYQRSIECGYDKSMGETDEEAAAVLSPIFDGLALATTG